MHKIKTYNAISKKGLTRFRRDQFQVDPELTDPDAILLRSHKLDASAIGKSLKAVARAGAGTNNVPVDACTQAGVVVFNTPGANANAVKELVLCGLLLASRGIIPGIGFASTQTAIKDEAELSKLMEFQLKRQKLRPKANGRSGATEP